MSAERKRRKRSSASTKMRKDLFELGVRAADIGVWEWNITTNDVTWSDGVLDIFGLTRDEFGGTYDSYFELIPDNERERVTTIVDQAVKEGDDFSIEHRIKIPGGTERWIAAYGSVFRDDKGRPQTMIGIVRDISDRKLVETRLSESEDRFRALSEASLEGIVISEGGRVVDCNQAAVRILGGQSADELVGKAVESLVHPADRGRVLEKIRSEEEQTYIHRGLKLDGSEVFLEVTGRKVVFLGRPMRLTSVRDVTDRVENEQLVASIVEHSKDWIWAMDLNGRHSYSNLAAESILGWSLDEIVGGSAWTLMHPEDVEKAKEEIERTVRERSGWNKLLIRWRHRDGSYRSLESNGEPTFDQTGELLGFRGVDRDVTDRLRLATERAKLEDQLRHAQKMEAVGQLAGGVAHDFNNLLTVICGNSELLEDFVESEELDRDEIRQVLGEIAQAANSATALTRQLLVFSRHQVTRPVSLDLNTHLSSLESMLRRLLSEDLNFDLDLKDELPPVFVDPGHLEQVLLNLVVNARDAMDPGGLLRLSTSERELSKEDASAQLNAQAGRFVVLRVSDTGKGMSEETIGRIFEPFFTTKPLGQGTGLGLSTVYGIVQQARGFITVYSEVNIGTTVSVFLPADEHLETPRAEAEPAAHSVGGSETILLCEDDASVRRLAARMLRSVGYSVLEAGSATAALEVQATHAGPIHLLLTDVILPDFDGKKLSVQLCERIPGLVTLFFSGYAAGVVSHRGVLDEGVALLSKPFAKVELLERVREILDTRS